MSSAQWALRDELLPEFHGSAKLGNMVDGELENRGLGIGCGVPSDNEADKSAPLRPPKKHND
jgi:hypothetical protein